MRQFIKAWCMSFGIVAGVYLTIDGYRWSGLYIIMMGLVLFVLEFQDNKKQEMNRRKFQVSRDILIEQFGRERCKELLDEFFIRHKLLTPEEIEKLNSETK